MSKIYEIVELTNGDIALQRDGGKNELPLVTMRFSAEILRFFQESKMDVAKVMIEAGLQHLSQIAEAGYRQEQAAKKLNGTGDESSPKAQGGRGANHLGEVAGPGAQARASVKAATAEANAKPERAKLAANTSASNTSASNTSASNTSASNTSASNEGAVNKERSAKTVRTERVKKEFEQKMFEQRADADTMVSHLVH